MSDKTTEEAIYGSANNPVIGVALLPEFEWKLLGNWPDAGRPDILPEMDPPKRTQTMPDENKTPT